MDIEKYGVDTDNLRRDASELRLNLKTLSAAYTQMQEYLNQLDAGWTGPAKDAFYEKFSATCEEYKRLFQMLDDITTNMEMAAKEYDSSDIRIRDIVDSILL